MSKKIFKPMVTSSRSRTSKISDLNNNSYVQKKAQQKDWKISNNKETAEKLEIPRSALYRIVKELLKEISNGKKTFIESEAIDILHKASEFHILNNFRMSDLARELENQRTLQQRHMIFCRKILDINKNGII